MKRCGILFRLWDPHAPVMVRLPSALPTHDAPQVRCYPTIWSSTSLFENNPYSNGFSYRTPPQGFRTVWQGRVYLRMTPLKMLVILLENEACAYWDSIRGPWDKRLDANHLATRDGPP
ncbi:hypothetical protein J6590_008624 [Homalodisca vitripennis]|nr:hypothetical protein J6590_008624 [Homalodisca vitripennis]